MFLIGKPKIGEKPTWKRRLIQICILLFLILGIGFIALNKLASKMVFKSQSPAQQAQIMDAENPEQFVKFFSLNGQDFYVPAVYFAYYIPSETVIKDTAFSVVYPNFQWDQKEPYGSRLYNENDVLILLTPKNDGRPFKEYLDFTLKNKMDKQFDLEKWISIKRNTFGDIYIHEGVDNPKTVISCDAEKEWREVDIRKCKMKFFDKFLFYQVQFDYKHLPQWKDIHQKTLNLIEQFQVKPESMKEN